MTADTDPANKGHYNVNMDNYKSNTFDRAHYTIKDDSNAHISFHLKQELILEKQKANPKFDGWERCDWSSGRFGPHTKKFKWLAEFEADPGVWEIAKALETAAGVKEKVSLTASLTAPLAQLRPPGSTPLRPPGSTQTKHSPGTEPEGKGSD